MDQTPRLSILFFVIAALFGALGQYLYKSGTENTTSDWSSYLYNLRIIGGMICYGLVMLCFVATFKRGGSMAVLYPIYASTFIWGALISALAYGTEVKSINITGMGFMIAGMYLMGK
ncbi:MAG: hypothetical protein NT027_16810 [Proteobacteria bacterium]|nr:hypothetical protein [Pseudomonadota bacterium]